MTGKQIDAAKGDAGKAKSNHLLLMQVVGQGGFGNTTILGGITIRTMLTLILVVIVGFVLWKSPLFHNNWPAAIAYLAFANLVLGHTPTGRNLLTNLYGIVFKKPPNMLVTEDMTVTTIGHGISEADLSVPNLDVVPFRMAGTKQFALVYNITSGIGYWSSEEAKVGQARMVKSLFNILEGGESLMIAFKQDNDTGMLKLASYLSEQESFEGDDLQKMSERRQLLLQKAGTSFAGRSIQQYAILLVKPKNVNRTVTALSKASRILRPATNPMDVLLATMGFEGGVEWCDPISVPVPEEKPSPRKRKTSEPELTVRKRRGGDA